MQNETWPDEGAVAESIRSLGSLANAGPLPDADWLWIRAQISAREEAATNALRRATLRKTLQYGLLSAGAAWLVLDWIDTQGPGFDAWVETSAAMSADPVVSIAISALAAIGAAALTGAVVFGRALVANRLRDFGLL